LAGRLAGALLRGDGAAFRGRAGAGELAGLLAAGFATEAAGFGEAGRSAEALADADLSAIALAEADLSAVALAEAER
jgi:hypothetical protein